MARTSRKRQARRERRAERFIEAFNAHKPKKALALMSDEPVWEFPIGPHEWGERFEGREAVRKAIKRNFKRHPDISYRILRRYTAAPDSVIFEVLVEAPKSGVREQSVDILTFDDDDRIAVKRAYRKVVT